jgi:hypothetical protein
MQPPDPGERLYRRPYPRRGTRAFLSRQEELPLLLRSPPRLDASTRVAEASARATPRSGRHGEGAGPSALQPRPEESADLYYRRPPKALAYHPFDNAGAAILFVRDNLTPAQMASAVLQVGELRFEGAEVAAMAKGLGRRRPTGRFDA